MYPAVVKFLFRYSKIISASLFEGDYSRLETKIPTWISRDPFCSLQEESSLEGLVRSFP